MDSDTTRPVLPIASTKFARIFGLPQPDLTEDERVKVDAFVAEGNVMFAAWVAADPARRAA